MSRKDLKWQMLIALVLVLFLQSARAFFTLVVNRYGEQVGLINAAPVVLIVFLAPFALLVVGRLVRTHVLLASLVLLAAALRLLMQVVRQPDPMLILSGLGVMVGLMTLPLLLALTRTARTEDNPVAAFQFVTALIWGLALDLFIHAVFLTWDPIWQPGGFPLLIVFVCAAAPVVLLWLQRRELSRAPYEPALSIGLPGVVLGPFVALHMMILHNAGFGAGYGLSLPLALALIGLGDAMALTLLRLSARAGTSRRVYWPLLVAVLLLTALLPTAMGIPGTIVFLLGHGVAAAALVIALSGSPALLQHPALWRTAVIAGIGSLLFVIPPVAYFAGQAVTLPFAAELLIYVLIALLLLAVFARPAITSVSQSGLRWQVLPLVLAPLITGIALQSDHRPAGDYGQATGLRVVSYNLHYGVSAEGNLDPEGLARVIEAQDPDVVALQEVSRGWLISGSVELLEWLAQRLDMPYVIFAPAADRQFGNAVLSQVPILASETAPLPTGTIPQKRSYLRVVLDTGPEPLMLIVTHLSAWVGPEQHLAQVETLLAVWDRAPRTLIVGDMNSVPGAPDIQMFLDAGLQSAQDAAGDPAALTANSRNPDVRIDWILGTSDLVFTNFAIPQSTASDHFPLVTDVSW